MNIHTEVAREGRLTTVTASSGTAFGVGMARCRPDDVYVRETGERIATARAIQQLGSQLETSAVERSVSLAEADRVLDAIVNVAFETLMDEILA